MYLNISSDLFCVHTIACKAVPRKAWYHLVWASCVKKMGQNSRVGTEAYGMDLESSRGRSFYLRAILYTYICTIITIIFLIHISTFMCIIAHMRFSIFVASILQLLQFREKRFHDKGKW